MIRTWNDMEKFTSEKSILFLGTQMAVGGAQRVLLDHAQWFYNKGYAVTAAFFYDKEGLHAQWKREYPFPIVDLRAQQPGDNWEPNFGMLMRSLIKLWALMRKTHFNIVETFTPHSNILGIPVAWLARIPVRVATHHGNIENTPSWMMHLHGLLVNTGLSTNLVAVSERVRRLAIEVEHINPEKIVVILNGITQIHLEEPRHITRTYIHDELGLSADTRLVLTVGRLTVQKGHTYLLDAVPAVLDQFPNTVFAIAGDGYLRVSLGEKTSCLGLDKSVLLLGTRSDIAQLLMAADLFVLPSLSEGLPLALLEAMGAGLPVVATSVEGMDAIIKNGDNGYIVPPADADALARAVIRILGEGEDVWRLFGERGKRLIEKEYTIHRACQQYEGVFLEKLG